MSRNSILSGCRLYRSRNGIILGVCRGVADYFNGGIYGAIGDYQNFSKKMMIDQILSQHQLSGSALLTFGDGYVEIEDTVAVGGLAIGVASNEAERQGIDPWKRQRLIEAGADIIIPDFREYKALLDYLNGWG